MSYNPNWPEQPTGSVPEPEVPNETEATTPPATPEPFESPHSTPGGFQPAGGAYGTPVSPSSAASAYGNGTPAAPQPEPMAPNVAYTPTPPPMPGPTFHHSSASTSPPSANPSTTPAAKAPAWMLPFAILAALALFSGGALTGWAIATKKSPAESFVAEEGTNTAVSHSTNDPGSTIGEPVADVARMVAPSVVQIETNTGLGSGVVFDNDGHILTAAHVLEGATQIRVRLADGRLLPGEVVGMNAATDVGVVAIEPPKDLRPARLGLEVPVEVGQLAVAVGSPFGLDQTVTSGIISATDRPVETESTSMVGMIQTDASINPGNSGGALADRQGRVIGINDAIRTAGGGNEGVGFAIPIDLANRIALQIIAGEEIQAGLLGVTVEEPSSGPSGALIKEIMEDSPAADSDLQIGDLITEVNGQPVSRTQGLRARILGFAPGTEVTLTVIRDGKTFETSVVLASATR
ncbi:MAG: trypsin-like peptidase domain-containing protein [Acidimicrobiia bacterium]